MSNMEVFEHSISEEEFERAKGILEERLDPSWIKQRDGGFGRKLDYIEGTRVIEILNRAFDYKWSFEIIDAQMVQGEPYHNKKANKVEEQGKHLQILGKLTVPGFGVKMAFGSKAIVGRVGEQESAYKAAMTDSLKKCATLFGIGKELYLGDEDEGPGPQSTPRSDRWSNAKTVAPPQKKELSYDAKDINRMKELKEKMGIEDNDKLKPIIKEWSGGTLSEPTDITPENIRSFIDYLESKV